LFPKIELHVNIAENAEVERMIESLEVDFGFMTKTSSVLDGKPFCHEEYILVGHRTFKELAEENIRDLPFLHYPGFDTALRNWEKARRLHWPIRFKGKISEQRGIISMLEAKEGVTIMARHCLLSALQSGRLVELRPDGKSSTNQIFMVQINGVQQTKAVRTVQDAFFDILQKK
ncbi:MAG: substrate-binding domain-containing protein, partial [Pseudobdellovibrionaceae bacterium]